MPGLPQSHNGYRSDAESWGRVIREILLYRKPKIWGAVLPTVQDEANYVAWAARWAFHWAAKCPS